MAKTGSLCWLAASNNCQIWDESLELTHNFSQGNILDTAWDLEGRVISFIFKNSNHILTTKLGIDFSEGHTNILEGDATSIEFLNDHLVVGTSTGSTLTWDYNKHKLVRKFSGAERTPVTRLQVNNSIIAAGHSSGVIQIYGIKTGISTAQCSIPNSGGIRDLKISSVKSSLMAAAFTSGTIASWNTCSNKGTNLVVTEFSCAHQAPATSVALSPVTDILMVSGGLDRNIILYDFPRKKILKKIETEAPVTAVEFFPDGTSLLVGTSKGKVFLYDLRSVSTPAKTIQHQASPVFRLICRHLADTQFRSGKLVNPKKCVSSCATTNDHVYLKGSTFIPERNIQETIGQIHSPIEPIKQHYISSTPGLTDLNKPSADFKPLDAGSTTKDTEPRNSSLFSPLKGEGNSEICISPSLATSPLLKFNPRNFEDTVKSCEVETGSVCKNEGDHIHGTLEKPKDLVSSEPIQTPLPTDTQHPESHVVPSSRLDDFQAEFIRGLIHEVENNLREVLRCRFGDLIVQSAQQFLTLQNELEQLKIQVQDKAHLEEEVRRLRQEVNQLRKLY